MLLPFISKYEERNRQEVLLYCVIVNFSIWLFSCVAEGYAIVFGFFVYFKYLKGRLDVKA